MVRHQLRAALVICLVLAGPALWTSVKAAQDSRSAATTTAPLNLNTATAIDLEKLPGVGAALASRILEYRQKSGGFKKIEELMNVQGIGERSFLRLKPLVTVTPTRAAER